MYGKIAMFLSTFEYKIKSAAGQIVLDKNNQNKLQCATKIKQVQ